MVEEGRGGCVERQVPNSYVDLEGERGEARLEGFAEKSLYPECC